MIKVPATEAGRPAIEELTARGVNVNIALLFSLARYEQVIDAYIAGTASDLPGRVAIANAQRAYARCVLGPVGRLAVGRIYEDAEPPAASDSSED